MAKMIIVSDCGSCEHCETVKEIECYERFRTEIYCSHPDLDNPTIWKHVGDEYVYPDFTIQSFCPLPDNENIDVDSDGNLLCLCPIFSEDCPHFGFGRCAERKTKPTYAGGQR